jgi:hypothetical protein
VALRVTGETQRHLVHVSDRDNPVQQPVTVADVEPVVSSELAEPATAPPDETVPEPASDLSLLHAHLQRLVAPPESPAPAAAPARASVQLDPPGKVEPLPAEPVFEHAKDLGKLNAHLERLQTNNPFGDVGGQDRRGLLRRLARPFMYFSLVLSVVAIDAGLFVVAVLDLSLYGARREWGLGVGALAVSVTALIAYLALTRRVKHPVDELRARRDSSETYLKPGRSSGNDVFLTR